MFLDPILAEHPLHEHPFYQAWRAGTLPRESLARYAVEYEPFIQSIELGWRTLGEAEHAAGEREHAELWRRFAAELGAQAEGVPAARALSEQVRAEFTEPVTALGALYAFEGQQPETARTKLEGLSRYGVREDAYFRVHAGDTHERDMLATRMVGLDDASRARAAAACRRTCEAMWATLTAFMPAAA